jgi:hypothetical protein
MTAQAVSRSTTVAAMPELLVAEFSGEFVILNLRDGVYYGLEDVGARVWALLQSPISIGQIVEALVSEYDVDAARCECDVRALVDDLLSRQLVEIRQGS